jgi:hypothetical protein
MVDTAGAGDTGDTAAARTAVAVVAVAVAVAVAAVSGKAAAAAVVMEAVAAGVAAGVAAVTDTSARCAAREVSRASGIREMRRLCSIWPSRKVTRFCNSVAIQLHRVRSGAANMAASFIKKVVGPIQSMKKILLALTFAAVSVGAMTSAFADDHDHHHPVCHKVKVHDHWEKRCK